MKNLKQLLTKPLKQVPLSLALIILAVALIGFVDSSYLTIEHFQGKIPPCSLTEGCDEVLTSTYSTLIGIPTALLGAIYYFIILVGVFAYIESKNTIFLKWAFFLTFIGIIMSLWFTYLQVFVIGSYCVYCLGSAATTLVLFILSLIVLKKYSQDEAVQNIGNQTI